MQIHPSRSNKSAPANETAPSAPERAAELSAFVGDARRYARGQARLRSIRHWERLVTRLKARAT